MDQHEEFYEEVSDEEVQVVQPAPVAVVAPLNVEVPEIPDNLESPSPQPSPISSDGSSPVAVGGPPVPPPPGEDFTSFMGFYTHEDLTELEQWTVDARAARRDPAARIEKPEVAPNLKIFLRYVYGTQWEVILIRESGKF